MLAIPAAHAEGKGDIRVTRTVVDHGTNVIVGTSKTIEYPIEITIKDNSGVKGLSRVSTFNRSNGYGFADWTGASCAKKSATTSVCTATMTIKPGLIASSDDIDSNKVAGVWQVNATVKAKDGDYWISDNIATYKVKRASVLVADASPEPVKRGGELTVTGKLTRAHWEDRKYYGFAGQPVTLQFKKAGTSSYKSVKTVRTGSTGKVSTTVTASAAGSWRWFFAGTTTTAQTSSTGDTVQLR